MFAGMSANSSILLETVRCGYEKEKKHLLSHGVKIADSAIDEREWKVALSELGWNRT